MGFQDSLTLMLSSEFTLKAMIKYIGNKLLCKISITCIYFREQVPDMVEPLPMRGR